MIYLPGKPLDFENLLHIQYEMCGLKATKKARAALRVAKDQEHSLAALDSFLPKGKIFISICLSSMYLYENIVTKC